MKSWSNELFFPISFNTSHTSYLAYINKIFYKQGHFSQDEHSLSLLKG